MVLIGVLASFKFNIFNSLKYSPTLEATCRLAVEDIPITLRTSKVYSRIHKKKPLVLALGHINPVNTPLINFFTTLFSVILHLRLGFTISVLPSGISIKLCMYLPSGICLFQLTLSLIVLVVFGEEL